MSSIADITVYDGAASPVQHVLKAISVTKDKGVTEALWREDLAGIPVYAQCRAKLRLMKLKSGIYRSEQVVEVPVMESVGSQNAAGYTAAPKVAYTNTFVLIGLFHERSDTVGRRLIRQMALNMATNSSTSNAPAPTGPTPDQFDRLVSPT